MDKRLVSVSSPLTTVIDSPSTGSLDSSVTVSNTISPGSGFEGLNTAVRFSIDGGSGLGSDSVVLIPETKVADSPLPCWATAMTVYSDTGDERYGSCKSALDPCPQAIVLNLVTYLSKRSKFSWSVNSKPS